ncbi:hypothetical protein L3V77_10540 [Vibrio sp. DW001]|uniref:hypothetical protein n=1 Tax=Vibrio sp. DW001 TaxID=2912315 RepID=UPI0023AFEF4A|nr:hypothetical protein [Vibrio sp. DW001]WED25504.1 hypothetical protein L3V77_10540 [Vibrio sp. DW001]
MDLLSFLGKTSLDIKLINFLKLNGIQLDSTLTLEEDDYDAYLEVQDKGLALLFTDEAKFLGLRNEPIGIGNLFFSNIFFYSEGKDGYTEYKDKLPFGLLFTDTRQDVINKLGQQSWERLARDKLRVISDRWDELPDVPYRLHVTYDKNTGRISIISVSIPDKPLS